VCTIRNLLQLIVSLAALLIISACISNVDAPRRYQLRGQILAVRPEVGEVLIKHGDIKNFMPGMTMPFKVRDTALLEGKAAGDLVTAQLMVGKDDAWLAALDKTGSAPLEEMVASPPAAFATVLEPGDSLPDVTLTDQNGATLRLSEWRNIALVMTFIYIRCPLPQFCPMMDRRFAAIQMRAQSDAMLTGRTRLLSVSFDPDRDTPAALKMHAETLGAIPPFWYVATAPPNVIDRFAAAFGVNVIRERDRTITHNLRTVLVAPDGRIERIYDGGGWTPESIVEDLRRVLAGS